MKLEEILPEIRKGRAYRRKAWHDGWENGGWLHGFHSMSPGDVLADDWELEPEELSIKVLNSVIPELPWIVTSHGWKTEKGIGLRPHSEIDALFAARQKMTGRPSLKFIPEYKEPPKNTISSYSFIEAFNKGWVACAEAHGIKEE